MKILFVILSAILTILSTILVTWILIREYFYSPKARVKRLWKEIYIISYKINKWRTTDSVLNSLTLEPYENAIRRKKKMVNALLDYYFDPEEDREYLEENRPD